MNRKRKSHYAIHIGQGAPCILLDWEETKQRITGYSFARHKGFYSKADAQCWLDGMASKDKLSKAIIHEYGLTDRVVLDAQQRVDDLMWSIYTDYLSMPPWENHILT